MEDSHTANEAAWREMLVEQHSSLQGRRFFRLMPSDPRCKMCNAPFGRPGRLVARRLGRRQSSLNPRYCGVCESFAREHPGGAVFELTMLFADVRGSTALAESLGTVEFTRVIERFYATATKVLIEADALIDRLLGDQVVALFVPALLEDRHAAAAVEAARALMRATGAGSPEGAWIPIGIGVHTGEAFVGALGTGGVTDVTALGDNVNATARLASTARPGEILLSEDTRRCAGLEPAGLERRTLQLKGRAQPLDAWLAAGTIEERGAD